MKGVRVLTRIILCSLLVSTLFCLSAHAGSVNSNSISPVNRIVNVGFFYEPGYNEMDSDGVKSGFNYELMEELRIFGCWDLEYVGYDKSFDDMFYMLDNKEIDILFNVAYSEVLAKKYLFSKYDIGSKGEPKYIITRIDDFKLMGEINQALETLKLIYPQFFVEIREKYFGLEESNPSYFTLKEIQFIEDHKDYVFTAVLTTGTPPLAYVDSENCISGILVDYAKLISEYSGLNIRLVGASPNMTINNAILFFNADLQLDVLFDFNMAEINDYRLSVPYINLDLVKVSLDEEGQNGLLGLVKTASYDYVADHVFPDYEYNLYQSAYDAFSALNDKSVDCIIVPRLTAKYFSNFYSYEYTVESFAGADNPSLSIAVLNSADPVLPGIIAKSLHYIDSLKKDEIIASYTYLYRNDFDLKDFIDKNPWIVWTATLLVLIVISIIIILSFKASSSKKEHELAVENLSYFKSILIANLLVFSFELKVDGTRKIYVYYKDDEVPYGNGIGKREVDENSILYYRLRIHPDDLNSFDELVSVETMKKFANEEGAMYYELRALSSEGGYFHVAASYNSMPSSDGSIRTMLIIKDIEATKRSEEEKRDTLIQALETARKFNASKNIFLSQMSHDIRTPMNAIVGMTNLAQINIDNKDKVKECLDIIENSSGHLLGLINDILDFSKIESGKLSFTNSTVSISASCKKVIEMHSQKMEKNGIRLSLNIDDIENDAVFTDATRLEQVFSNIISNAVKYSKPKGRIGITLKEISSTQSDSHFYEFSVSDTGIGMSEETLSHIFNPFERAKEVAFVEGSGLGMAITKNIVDALGGSIKVESALGKGTKVTVSFCFSDLSNSSLAEYTYLRGKKALIISPDITTNIQLTEIFKEANMEVDVFSDPASFIETYGTLGYCKEYALISVSLLRPLKEEIAFLKQLREATGPETIIFDLSPEDWTILNRDDFGFVFDGYSSLPFYKTRIIRIVGDGIDRLKREKKGKIEATAKGKRALIVEDVEINAMFAEAIAEMKGFVSDIAKDGKEAFNMLEESKDGYYSIVLMDIQMPVMNGYESAKLIRQSERRYLKEIPIIAMSANTFEDDILKAIECGMNDHLAKPVDINRFSDLVDLYVKD